MRPASLVVTSRRGVERVLLTIARRRIEVRGRAVAGAWIELGDGRLAGSTYARVAAALAGLPAAPVLWRRDPLPWCTAFARRLPGALLGRDPHLRPELASSLLAWARQLGGTATAAVAALVLVALARHDERWDPTARLREAAGFVLVDVRAGEDGWEAWWRWEGPAPAVRGGGEEWGLDLAATQRLLSRHPTRNEDAAAAPWRGATSGVHDVPEPLLDPGAAPRRDHPFEPIQRVGACAGGLPRDGRRARRGRGR